MRHLQVSRLAAAAVGLTFGERATKLTQLKLANRRSLAKLGATRQAIWTGPLEELSTTGLKPRTTNAPRARKAIRKEIPCGGR